MKNWNWNKKILLFAAESPAPMRRPWFHLDGFVA